MKEAAKVLKYIVVGDTDVGKTAIMNRYVKGSFLSDTTPTIGAASLDKQINFSGTDYIINIWDTAGQETFRNLVPIYFKKARVAFIVFDVTSSKSADDVDDWYNIIMEHCEDPPIIMLVANKIDKVDRVIQTDEVQKIAQKYNIKYAEVSAKENIGIEKLFEFSFFEVMKTQTFDKKEEPKLVENKKGCC